jgi:predicted PhzF superfamily epimerase YddE/YHI9
MNAVRLFHVSTDENGNYGDAASVVLDEGKHISDPERQTMTRKLNTGETIFINDVATADITVMHPQGEIDFAGVGVLATAWLLTKIKGKQTTVIHGRDNEITTWQDGEITWVQSDLSTMPPWHHKQLGSAEAVERLTIEEMKTTKHTMTWAWINEAKGLIRARTFASDWDIPEAQGNGSGSMLLAAQLERSVEIRHGKGSIIFAKPAADNCADIGGRLMQDKGGHYN